MAIVDIQRLSTDEDLRVVNATNGSTIPWIPQRLTSFESGGQSYLIAGGGHAAGVGVATFASNGRIDFIDAYGTSFNSFSGISLWDQGVVAHRVDGSQFVYAIGGGTYVGTGNYHVSVLNFDTPTDPQLIQRFADDQALGEAGINGGFDPVVIETRGKSFLAISVGRDETLHTYRIKDNGELGPLKVSETNFWLSDGYTTAEHGNSSYIVSFGAYDDAPIQVLKLNARGFLKPVFDMHADEPEIFNQQTKGMASAVVDGRTFVFASEVTRGTILSYEMKASGALELVDKIGAGFGDQWGFPEGLETLQHEGETYLLSGGYGASLGVFKVADGGSLIEVDEFGAGVSSTGRVRDTEVIQIDGKTFIATTTLAGDPLASYRFVPNYEEISGGGGRNRLEGTEADDQIFANAGNDRVLGDAGDDLIEGGKGNDTLLGQDGHDDIYGGDGRDTIKGGAGDEFIFGEADRDLLKGEDGNDYLVGGGDKDRILGQDGSDRLFGGPGKDTLIGGTGNDRLSDGAGANDRMRGDAGADLFIMARDNKRDIILDYEDGIDKIDLRAESPKLFTDLDIRQEGDSLLVSYASGSILIHAADGQIFDFELGESDFLFA